ncbi:uncharacterized protein BDV14DRAFT_163651, partial [Aspergillus stella-maris]|uniref:uncharacterized protein n=1 Tax=Aspergillus stella-maris TaxID=1810926 RepID=UPI003CCCFB62
MGTHLGDWYWRSRIPDLFHEIREPSVACRILNWEYLSSGLKKLELELESNMDEHLQTRREVLKQLDEIDSLIN